MVQNRQAPLFRVGSARRRRLSVSLGADSAASLSIGLVVLLMFSGCAEHSMPLAFANAESSAQADSSAIIEGADDNRVDFDTSFVREGRPTSGGKEVAPLTALSPRAKSEVLARLFASFPTVVLDQQNWDTTGAASWVDSTLAAMTLNEKLGQLIVVRLGLGRGETAPRTSDTRAVTRDAVGGFIISRLLPPEDVAAEVGRLQSLSKVPLFFSADYERGVGRFSNNFTELPSNMAIGATRDTIAAEAAGILTAMESRAIGVNLLFAPVADVNNNPANPIINIRSYGHDPEWVGTLARRFVAGAEAFGVLTTAKHFPGHGNSSIDTHSHMGVVDGSLEELASVELLPFYRLLDSPTPPSAVMMAHLGLSAMDDTPTPSTLSANVTGYLRGMSGRRTLIITDDVRMGALQNDYSLAERVVGPIAAGADIILTPESVPGAIAALRESINSGRLSVERINQSVRRILQAKAKIGLHRNAMPHWQSVRELAAVSYGQQIADSIALKSITKLSTRLPEVIGQTSTLIQLSNFSGSESIDSAMSLLAESLGVGSANELRLSSAPTKSVIDWVGRQTHGGTIVIALHLRLQSGRGSAGLADGHAKVVEEALALGRPVVVAIFGNPYVADDLQQADGILIGYDQSLATIRAVAGVLLGKEQAHGMLPVGL